MSFLVVIPARHDSTRLPGKMLIDIAGKPMVLHVVERARESAAEDVVVATDHVDIESALSAHGVRTLLTSAAHASGTDRLAEAVAKLKLADDDVVVNIQGDEPLIDPALVDAVAETLLANPQASLATAARPMIRAADFFNPNFVKVVCDASGMALYFSRAPIPFARDAFSGPAPSLPANFSALHHIGIYAYRAGFLKRFCGLPQSPAEKFEALEQLRALHHGYRIAVKLWERPLEAGVDTPEDLERVRGKFL
jgi:3-deoxy-manno-octulosonate cytidylyltransferase (CMP-KDO synthetase)